MERNVPEMFGSLVFNQKVMRERLPRETYKALKKHSITVFRFNWTLQTRLQML